MPGARSQRPQGISSMEWNAQVAHILTCSSPNGYPVVWDLRGKREVVALQYGRRQRVDQGQHWVVPA